MKGEEGSIWCKSFAEMGDFAVSVSAAESVGTSEISDTWELLAPPII